MASSPRFSVVVTTYRRPAALARCLRALCALAPPAAGDRYEIVVVDDGSEPPVEPVVAAARAAAPATVEITSLRQANAGPAAARNAGAAAARGEFLAFTDDDCAPRPGWLVGFAQQAQRTPGALLGGRTVNAVPANLWSEASQRLVSSITDYFAAPGRVGFFASNNIALPPQVFAYRYHRLRAARAGAPPQVEPARSYLNLVDHPLRDPGRSRRDRDRGAPRPGPGRERRRLRRRTPTRGGALTARFALRSPCPHGSTRRTRSARHPHRLLPSSHRPRCVG